MPTIYLHIGMPKTATTSLQRFLFKRKNREILTAHGICCPDTGCRYDRISYRRNGHFLVASEKDFAGGKSKRQLREIYKNSLDELAGSAGQHDKIILSDESIWKRGYTRHSFWPYLKENLDERGLDIRIILYLRRQDLWMESYYAQETRAGKNSDTFTAFIKNVEDSGYPLDYCKYMDDLASLFGKDKLLIRVFERGQFRGDEQTVYSDFLDIFGLSLKEGFIIQKEMYNTRYEGDLLEFRRILNSLPEFQTAFHPLRDYFDQMRNMNLINCGDQYSYFTSEERERFLTSFEESNRRLAAEYLGRQDGILFRDTADVLPVYQPDQYELFRSAALIWAKKIMDIDARNERMEQEIAELRKRPLSTGIMEKAKCLLEKAQAGKTS